MLDSSLLLTRIDRVRNECVRGTVTCQCVVEEKALSPDSERGGCSRQCETEADDWLQPP